MFRRGRYGSDSGAESKKEKEQEASTRRGEAEGKVRRRKTECGPCAKQKESKNWESAKVEGLRSLKRENFSGLVGKTQKRPTQAPPKHHQAPPSTTQAPTPGAMPASVPACPASPSPAEQPPPTAPKETCRSVWRTVEEVAFFFLYTSPLTILTQLIV
ncbi:hypothetical protein B0T21DRAFT_344053 [Apiosordaria backusii]|uniref:Uncharacterized protein n=1 Tax=Apiosordaria backusii TaxID=314023 RepID=A0AA40EZF5_9PEZI|nr:hypothetical protein B0T21DRAFT_344053 [Apiosordaria backusii]